MKAIWLVASNTLKQTVRQRLFLNIGIFGIGLVLLSIVVGQITLGYQDRVVRSIGLSGVSLALNLMALLVAVGLIYNDIDKKTLFVVLTRPLSRSSYVIGRYLGLLLALALALLGFIMVFALALSLIGGDFGRLDLLALAATFPEAATLGAFGIVLSAFSTPTLSAGLGLGFWLAAATTDDLVNLTSKSDAFTKGFAQVVYYVLPSLERFNFRENAVYEIPVTSADVLSTFCYGGLYLSALVALACVITSRREMV